MENGYSSRFVVSILLSKRFTVKKLSWCLFCHSLLLHLNDDTRQKNIFFCRVPWRVLPPNIWSLTAIKANCPSKGKLFICFWSMCSAQISFFLTFRHISRSETAHLLVPYPDSAWDKEGARPSKPWDKGKAQSRKIFSAFRASVWCKNKGSRAPRAPTLDPPTACLQKLLLTSKNFCKEYFVERNQTKSTAAAYFKLQMSIEAWRTLMRLE